MSARRNRLLWEEASYGGGTGKLVGPSSIVALFTAIAVGVFALEAIASNGVRMVIPINRTGTAIFSKQSGLQIAVDTTWAGNRGYRPVKVTATMTKPATADTLITIDFHAGGWRNRHQSMSVEYDFELAQGQTSTTATFVVPQYTDWNTYGWTIWVDGAKDEQLCLAAAGYNTGSSGALAAGIFMPKLANLDPTELLSAVSSNALESHVIDGTNLPDRWIEYTPLDVVAASGKTLEFAQISSPEKFVELLRWVRAGGNLWVTGIGQDFSLLPELEELLNTIRANGSEFDSATSLLNGSPLSGSHLNAWHFLKLGGDGRRRLNDLVTLTMEESDEASKLSPSELIYSSNSRRAVDSRQWLVARAYGLGTIVALQFNGESRRSSRDGTASALQRCSLSENLHWATRHGNDPAGGNPSFNNLLIPDVGTAPVFEFQLLISLFVIGIGPVNYWLLKRRNLLPLLLVTVPVAALAATVLLFTYGFLADGIGVRVRTRSLTMLDQRAGEVASWARLSYFAGIAPSDGLRMPADTTIYPILPSRSERSSFGRRHVNQQRALEWNQPQRRQQLTRGWLASRTPAQYLAITARATKKHLQFDAQANQLAVTNHLGTQVLALVVQDHEGSIFSADQIEVEGSEKLEPSNYVTAASKLRQHITENLPQLPAGYVEPKRSRRGDQGVATSEGLMELQLEAIVSPLAIGWGNGTYVAVTTGGIELPLGIDGATESNSFHVLRGTW